jgi:hypothetical protein
MYRTKRALLDTSDEDPAASCGFLKGLHNYHTLICESGSTIEENIITSTVLY